MTVIGRMVAVAEFEGDVLSALDAVEAIRNRASMAGATFAGEIDAAYRALCRARYEVDSWKESA